MWGVVFTACVVLLFLHLQSYKLNEHSIRHLHSQKLDMHCNTTSTTTVKLWSRCHGTQPPWPTLTFFFVCLRSGGLPGAGTYVTPSLGKEKKNYAGSKLLPASIRKRRHIGPKCRDPHQPPSLNHAACVITTSGVFSVSYYSQETLQQHLYTLTPSRHIQQLKTNKVQTV